jgi:DNA polymerase-3 subunit delta'
LLKNNPLFSFHEIIGHDHIKDSLIRQVRSGKLHHAHLFLGPMGNGSFQLAMAFLKYAYCKNRLEDDSCGECSNCQKFVKFSHPDIHFAFPSFDSKNLSDSLMSQFKQIATDTNAMFDLKDWLDFNQKKNTKIRASECDIIINNMSMSSYENGYKTQVIWMAERLEKESNKILKILEEPNPNCLFILTAESSEDLLPTILSRCNIHKIGAPDDNTLTKTLKQSMAGISDDVIQKSIIFSEGNIIEAKRYIADFDSSFSLEENLKKFLKGLIVFEQRKFSNISNFIQFSEDIAGQSQSIQLKFLEYLLYFLRQLTIYKYTNNCEVSESILKVIQYFAPILDIDQIEAWNHVIEKTMMAIEGNANVKLSFVSLGIESGKIHNKTEFEIYINTI